ncbi:hypothetical protein [Nocardia huaxiensis]|uniref:Uncharacterized protein n=1 Tax=Nocardia huaxiensis TaxID=2755382 RepID=A0A7D6V7W7_9NOCA|nr:hypothetical protein [Nocardia huaxiensis]QLY29812.1 hypothetical protein H0264_32110 [Nocardia huaxiensis]UFS96599.1 hypothetical protein LPY97_01260 [Nocardia huaxiensis]
MKRSALLLVTTAGMILAGAGATEMLGDHSSGVPTVKTLAQQRFVAQDIHGEITQAACLRSDR